MLTLLRILVFIFMTVFLIWALILYSEQLCKSNPDLCGGSSSYFATPVTSQSTLSMGQGGGGSSAHGRSRR